jgi:hypothetical protein
MLRSIFGVRQIMRTEQCAVVRMNKTVGRQIPMATGGFIPTMHLLASKAISRARI